MLGFSISLFLQPPLFSSFFLLSELFPFSQFLLLITAHSKLIFLLGLLTFITIALLTQDVIFIEVLAQRVIHLDSIDSISNRQAEVTLNFAFLWLAELVSKIDFAGSCQVFPIGSASWSLLRFDRIHIFGLILHLQGHFIHDVIIVVDRDGIFTALPERIGELPVFIMSALW